MCPQCGCKVRAGTVHRALTAEESWRWGALWIKRIKVAFGMDWSEEPIR